jgi:hypothetical protein
MTFNIEPALYTMLRFNALPMYYKRFITNVLQRGRSQEQHPHNTNFHLDVLVQFVRKTLLRQTAILWQAEATFEQWLLHLNFLCMALC